MINAPKFWFEKKNIISILCTPFSYIYLFFHYLLRSLSNEHNIKIPVICIGDMMVGGSGKTPTVIAMRDLLRKQYNKIHVLSRGYKGSFKNSLIVEKNHSHELVGDEALIHRKHGFICVSASKVKGAKKCIENKADLILMDDGFQSKNIKKDISFIVCDSLMQFGNKRVIPAGPLREKLKIGFERADAIIFLKNEDEKPKIDFDSNIPIFTAVKKTQIPNFRNKNVYAFCAIGFPEKFFFNLEQIGLTIKKKKSFPDHYKFSDKEITKIIQYADENELEVITSLKDIVKINPIYRKKIKTAGLSIKFESKLEIKEFIKKKIKN